MYAKSKRALRRILRPFRSAPGRHDIPIANESDSFDEVRRDRERFDDWRRRNPAKSYKDYSAGQIEATLNKGTMHPSLGGNLRSGRYEDAGLKTFNNLRKYGLKPEDTCVDYGCGTMRVGQHVIGYLERGRYWGFDISPLLLETARTLIGEKVTAEKCPQLRTISTDSVAEAGAAGPTFLFSHRVLPHVHRSDLSEYFRNIMALIGRSGQAVIDGKWSETETVQYKQGSWAHSEAELRALASSMGGRLLVVLEKEHVMPSEPDRRIKKGVFRLVHEANAQAFTNSKRVGGFRIRGF